MKQALECELKWDARGPRAAREQQTAAAAAPPAALAIPGHFRPCTQGRTWAIGMLFNSAVDPCTFRERSAAP